MFNVACERCGAVMHTARTPEELVKPWTSLCATCSNSEKPPFEITMAVAEDFPQIMALGVEIFGRWIGPERFCPPALNAHLFMVVRNRRRNVVGYAMLRDGPEFTTVNELAVAPEIRRRGIATVLLGAVELYAANRGRGLLMAATPRSNQGAMRLFRRAGYIVLGVDRGLDVFVIGRCAVAKVAQ